MVVIFLKKKRLFKIFNWCKPRHLAVHVYSWELRYVVTVLVARKRVSPLNSVTSNWSRYILHL